ncbi:MBL fold metallo-hydrolase [Kineobactrum sediminis]|uniref:MBL fold metallo-hydrolase n=1 Tax=Kineobactrum sediminis TaxID=1905677 RepID=A0A2N5Y6N8_9GAMM|nr:MBL fold metallo-hydrolase [Kineobactrum sediminis]PLW84029.1 MBL fold metallo-hydrolase [Kineobactrum sediminis]
MLSFTTGDFEIHNIEEWQGEFASPEQLFAGFDACEFAGFVEQIPHSFYRPESNSLYAFLQSWVIKAGDLTILYDTGAGNNKERPGIPVFGELNTPFLANLAAAGFKPEDIDVVICSHLHIDHVGWNTHLQSGHWVPTFPRARYLFSRIERTYWDPIQTDGPRPSATGAEVNTNVFEDSVQPILDAGQAQLVDDGHSVTPGVTVSVYPGHTPGHLVLHLDSKGDHALFVGDILHHPAQVFQPDWNSVYCEDSAAAQASRKKILALAADTNARLVPAHFGGAHFIWIERSGNGFIPCFERDA